MEGSINHKTETKMRHRHSLISNNGFRPDMWLANGLTFIFLCFVVIIFGRKKSDDPSSVEDSRDGGSHKR